MKGYIYHIIHDSTGKRYIGVTNNFKRRIADHLRELNGGCHHSPKLQNSWNKHGEEKFSIESREVDVSGYAELFAIERQEIAKYNSFNDGFNCTNGGEGASSLKEGRVQDLLRALCVAKRYPNVGHSIEEYHGWHRNTVAPLVRGDRFPMVWEIFSTMSELERIQMGENFFHEWGIRKIYEERAKKKGQPKINFMTDDDYFFVHAAAELGYSAPTIATFLDLKSATVKDWINGRSKGKIKEKYSQLTEEEKQKKREEVEANRLYTCEKLTTTKENLENILDYLSAKEYGTNISDMKFERFFGWTGSTCLQIRTPNLKQQPKRYFADLTNDEKYQRYVSIEKRILNQSDGCD